MALNELFDRPFYQSIQTSTTRQVGSVTQNSCLCGPKASSNSPRSLYIAQDIYQFDRKQISTALSGGRRNARSSLVRQAHGPYQVEYFGTLDMRE